MKTGEVENKNSHDKAKGKILVVADDFTGANDTGVQFSKKHLKSIVITDKDNINKSLKKCDVVVVDIESRFDNAEKAYGKAFEIGKALRGKKFRCIYKKLDSTFRGNIGAEISGLMDSLGLQNTILVPAFPSNNRIIRNGMVYVNGVLLSETEVSHDPRTPVKESFIPKIISFQTDKSTGLLSYKDIEGGKGKLAQKLKELIDNKIQIIVADTSNDDDMDLIASVVVSLGERVLFAGSTGFAGYIPLYLDPVKKDKINIVIAGSVSNRTRDQIDYAVNRLPLSLIEVDICKLFNGEKSREKGRILDSVSESARSGKDVIIRSAPSITSVSDSFDLGQKYGHDRSDVSEMIALFLGEITADIIRQIDINGLLLTGGDTAIKTARSLEATGIILDNEIQSGIPYGHFIEEQFRDITVVTKAGGFGREDAIFQTLNFLTSIHRK